MSGVTDIYGGLHTRCPDVADRWNLRMARTSISAPEMSCTPRPGVAPAPGRL